jgi:hypothetical protein
MSLDDDREHLAAEARLMESERMHDESVRLARDREAHQATRGKLSRALAEVPPPEGVALPG